MLGNVLPGSMTIKLSDAQKILGVSRSTLWRIIRQYNIDTFDDVLDLRVTRVRQIDIERIQAQSESVRKGLAA